MNNTKYMNMVIMQRNRRETIFNMGRAKNSTHIEYNEQNKIGVNKNERG